MSAGDKSYLGDGVYVELENDMIRLTTESGISATNTIYLEPEVWRALKLWVEATENAIDAQRIQRT
jgi:hypothetical protein